MFITSSKNSQLESDKPGRNVGNPLSFHSQSQNGLAVWPTRRLLHNSLPNLHLTTPRFWGSVPRMHTPYYYYDLFISNYLVIPLVH